MQDTQKEQMSVDLIEHNLGHLSFRMGICTSTTLILWPKTLQSQKTLTNSENTCKTENMANLLPTHRKFPGDNKMRWTIRAGRYIECLQDIDK